MANFVASGLFGDGAAAVVAVGERWARRLGLTSGLTVVATCSRLYPDTERVMGWDIGGSGFHIVLDAGAADVVEAHLGEDVRAFLETHNLKSADIGTWVAHPGRAQGAPRDAARAGPDRRRPPGHLEVPGRDRQPPPPPCSTSSSTPSPTVARPRGPRACCSPWDRASAPNSSCFTW